MSDAGHLLENGNEMAILQPGSCMCERNTFDIVIFIVRSASIISLIATSDGLRQLLWSNVLSTERRWCNSLKCCVPCLVTFICKRYKTIMPYVITFFFPPHCSCQSHWQERYGNWTTLKSFQLCWYLKDNTQTFTLVVVYCTSCGLLQRYNLTSISFCSQSWI